MCLSDDEQIVTTPYNTGMKYETSREGDIKATTINKKETGMEHLKQAFHSVKLVRGILSDYVDQYIGFQTNEGASSDLVRSQNVKALGDHIRLTFDSINFVEDILEGKQAEPVVEPSDKTNDHIENMSDSVKEALESIKIIRGILSDYVDQYVDFQASEGVVDDLDRSKNIKALGDHIRLTFDSVKAIEDILQNVESVKGGNINGKPLEGENVNDKKPLEGEQDRTRGEQSEEHGESNDQVENMSDYYCWNWLTSLSIVLLQVKNWLTN